jgi:DNA-binding NtrC family response regulator
VKLTERTRLRRILVIDDDESFLRVITRILELEGHGVETARTGKEAIERSNLGSYDLAIIDVRLPDMNGTALLTAMRDTTPRMIKIMLTGYGSAEDKVEAIKRNADDYLVKPIQMDNLLGTIKNHLEKQSRASR